LKQFFRSRRAWLLILALAVIAAIAIIIAPAFGGLGIDSGLFDQQDCKSPCWNGLTPGQSTSEDVDDFLANLGQGEWSERNVNVYDTDCKSIRLVSKFELVDLYVVDDKLTFIRSGSFHQNKTRLGKVVDNFGQPEYFKAVLYIGFDYYVYTLEVYYPQKGLAFEILLDQDKEIGWTSDDIFGILPDKEIIVGEIRADMVVSAIHYFEPGDLSSYYLSEYFCSLEKEDAISRGQTEIENFIQEWSGFGDIDVIIDAELHRE
jgi:hypothetical protein